MQFRTVIWKSSETQAYFDSITEVRTGFKATCSVDGDKLKFDVSSINLQCWGKLNKADDIAKGIWSQGGLGIPWTPRSTLRNTKRNSVPGVPPF